MQVSLAMDAITKDLSEKRKGTSLAYLCTPTDLHLVPEEAHNASLANFEEFSKKPLCKCPSSIGLCALFCSVSHVFRISFWGPGMLMRLLSRGKFLRKNARAPVAGEGGDYHIVNEVSVAQGPNYILAKRMQHWRAITARSKGCIVSSNIAPSTSTVSVVQNR